jgi:uroporphyrinogen-III synthase
MDDLVRDVLAFREAFPGERTDLQPAEDVRAAGLLRAFAAQGVGGKRVLLPVSSQARRELEHGLREGGAIVERVVAYRTVAPEGAAPALKACLERDPDLFVFASPSAVEGIAAVSAGGLAGRPAVVIGPTTEAAARQAGLRVLGVASQPTVEGLLQAVVLALGRRGEERDSLTRRP